MPDETTQLAIVGLGSIGGNLGLQARERGFRVHGFDTRKPSQELLDAGVEPLPSLEDLRARLPRPRVIFLYVPAGPIVDTVLDDLLPVLEPDDIIVDGGNSYWGDSRQRHGRLKQQGLHFVDMGTSGGPAGARAGACFMAGGEREALEHVEPILRALAVEGGYVHAGPPGAGHFVKLVHNGIEFGMLQAIGEGIDLLEHYRDDLPVADIVGAWSHGSVIRSWLMELMRQQYQEQDGLGDVPGYVEDTGEVNWLVDDALQMEVPVPVITQSVMQLLVSRDDTRNWARAVAMMRHGFGGHPFGEDPNIARNRGTSRLSRFPPDHSEEDET